MKRSSQILPTLGSPMMATKRGAARSNQEQPPHVSLPLQSQPPRQALGAVPVKRQRRRCDTPFLGSFLKDSSEPSSSSSLTISSPPIATKSGHVPTVCLASLSANPTLASRRVVS